MSDVKRIPPPPPPLKEPQTMTNEQRISLYKEIEIANLREKEIQQRRNNRRNSK